MRLEVFTSKTALAKQAAAILQSEVLSARQQSKQLIVILPTGSTPEPFYAEVVSLWKSGKVDLSDVVFFNMDEYVGLAQDHPQSYAHYMHRHFYQHLLGQPRGIPLSHRNFPTDLKAEPEQQVRHYRQRLEAFLSGTQARRLVFGGIGRGPAHIAFNDFTDELAQLPEAERQDYALQTPTRIVKLDEATRHANKRFFADQLDQVPGYAMTVGFKDLLACDKIVIMANDPSKKEAIRSVFASADPTVTIPASLLRLHNGDEAVFLITGDALDPALLNNNAKLNTKPAAWHLLAETALEKPNAGLLAAPAVSQKSGMRHLSWPKASTKISIVDNPDLGRELLARSLSEPALLNLVPDLSGALQGQPDILIFPEQDLAQVLSLLQANHQSPLLVAFETSESRLQTYNRYLLLNQQALDKQQLALNWHTSQVRRTPFAEIPVERSKQVLADLGLVKSNASGAELYRLETYRSGNRQAADLHQKSMKALALDKLSNAVIVAPHPDDAEIGCGGLIQALAGKDIPLTVVNATTGSHTAISLGDLRAAPGLHKDLLVKFSDKDADSTAIESAELRSQIRAKESRQALTSLHPGVRVVNLALGFYDGEALAADRQRVRELINREEAHTPRPLWVLPDPVDAHASHRATTELFQEALLAFSKERPNERVRVLFYRTPWTGSVNLYFYAKIKGASLARALIGSERLGGAGSSGRALLQTVELQDLPALGLTVMAP